jgi:hypothetical protein
MWCWLGESATLSFHIGILVSLQPVHDILELREAKNNDLIKHQGRVHHRDSCRKGWNLAKKFVKEITGEKKGPLTVMADNQGAIALAKDNKFCWKVATK